MASSTRPGPADMGAAVVAEATGSPTGGQQQRGVSLDRGDGCSRRPAERCRLDVVTSRRRAPSDCLSSLDSQNARNRTGKGDGRTRSSPVRMLVACPTRHEHTGSPAEQNAGGAMAWIRSRHTRTLGQTPPVDSTRRIRSRTSHPATPQQPHPKGAPSSEPTRTSQPASPQIRSTFHRATTLLKP
jgi:hypothetical protein